MQAVIGVHCGGEPPASAVNSSLWASYICATGYQGPKCAKCAEDFYAAALGNCKKCDGSEQWAAWLLLVVCLSVAGVMFGCILLRGDRTEKKTEEKEPGCVENFCARIISRVFRYQIKLRILIAMFQVLTQLGMVFDLSYPGLVATPLSWLSLINLDLFGLAPIDCIVTGQNFYTSLVSTTVLPLVAVGGLLVARAVAIVAHKPEVGARCVVGAFFVIFLVFPSVSARVFTTFNCETFDGEFDGSDSWMRADLSVDCNAPERTGWIAFARFMILLYPARPRMAQNLPCPAAHIADCALN